MTVGRSSGAVDTARPIHTVSFKCTDEQYIVADTLRASFDPPNFSQAMRWLLDSPEVRAAIRARVNGGTR